MARNKLRHVAGLADGAPVNVPNEGDAFYATDGAGNQWVRKRVVNTGCEGLLAEAAGWLLGNRLGVPVPDAAVCLERGEESWLSRVVPLVLHWAPANAGHVVNLRGLGAMVTLDVLILNEDRHAGNILLQPSPDLSHLKAWAIDAGTSVIGHPEDFALRTDELPGPRNHAKGFPVEKVRRDALEVAGAAERLREKEVIAYMSRACKVACEPEVDTVARVLFSRCRRARSLVTAYLDVLGARP